MQAKNNFLLLLFIVIAAVQLIGQTANLTVSDPRIGWRVDQGTIEEATFEMRPQGIYTAVDMYLTFSAKGLNYSNSDTLEVVLDFQLPGGAIVIDSWLWIDDIIVKADILDRWTASGIYEEIVGRRQDPSILFKNGDGNFQLRIFPMAGDRSRKVKISYLAPTDWTKEQVITELPYHILQASRFNVEAARLRVFNDGDWGEPALSNGVATFEWKENRYWEAPVTSELIGQRASVVFATPLKNGVFVSHHAEGSGGFYQLALLPEAIFGVEEVAPRRLLVLLEHIPENASVTREELLHQVEQLLRQELSPNDYFNIIISKLDVAPLAPDWITGTPEAISDAFDALRSNSIASYSNLPAMLGAGISFIKNSGNAGEILLVANSSEVGSVAVGNQLIQDIRNSMGDQMIPVHVCDYQEQNFRFYASNNRSFRGNEYFYSNITRITAGTYINRISCCGSFAESVARAVRAATALRGTFDLYTRLENGLCYNRYDVRPVGDLVAFNRPVFQIGKYEGTFPFIIEAVGSLEGNLLSANIVLSGGEVTPGDTLTRQAWAGNHIQALERSASSNDVISRIINESISERVLSLYTAFIALEPSLGGVPCLDCIGDDETVIVSADDITLADMVRITSAPNPFRERTTIFLEFSETTSLEDWRFAVYNLNGQEIQVFRDVPNQITGRLELNWEAGADVAPGIYLFVIQSPHGRYNLKLVKF